MKRRECYVERRYKLFGALAVVRSVTKAVTWGGMTGYQWALLGAVLAFIGGGMGSSMGITYVNHVASGILVEDPEKFGPLLPIIAIPGTQGVYGLITAILVPIIFSPLGKISAHKGVLVFFACLPVAFVCFLSAVYQGLSSASAAAMVARRTEEAGKALILPALVETYAVFSLILTIYLFTRIR
ncbi:MAG: V-type ATP synthase subunit K [Actinobacteria bacterium]|nr:V-type ATP synthase subunit K [Actinomycetota bacterium]